MKKLLALLLTLAMCASMAACGSSAPAEKDSTATSKTEQTASTETEQQEEIEESTEYQYLAADKVEEYYNAIANGEVQGAAADVLMSFDEETMKLAIDAVAMIIGEEDFLGQLAGFDAQTVDQLMTEVMFIINQSSEAETEDPFVSEGGEEFTEEMGTTMTLYDESLDRSLVIDLNPDNAFMEPDWVMIKDQPINYFISIDNNYETYALTYGAMNRSTEELINIWVSNDAKEGKETTVTNIETFTAGGIEWELFALVYEKESSGIDKETGEQVTFTDTVYETICFARPDSETALQIDAANSSNPDVLNHYKEIIQKSIKNITIQ